MFGLLGDNAYMDGTTYTTMREYSTYFRNWYRIYKHGMPKGS